MGVSTEERRRAAQDSSHPGVLPVADGSQDITDRGHLCWLYVTSEAGASPVDNPDRRRGGDSRGRYLGKPPELQQQGRPSQLERHPSSHCVRPIR